MCQCLANMPLSTIIPSLGSKGSSTKDQVVSILSREWPLSAKELFGRVQRDFSSPVSYQAVHKGLGELLDSGVLRRIGKGFELNPVWVSQLKDFAVSIESNFHKKGLGKLQSGLDGFQAIRFDDPSVFFVEMAKLLQSNQVLETENFEIASMLNHLWFPPTFSFEDFQLLKKMIASHRGKEWLVCRSDTPFDRWVLGQYAKAGGSGNSGKLGVPFFSEHDVIAAGEHVFEVSFSPETKRLIEQAYNKSQNLEDLYQFYQQNDYAKYPFDIKLTITKNRQMAKTIQEYVKGFFKEGKQEK